MKCKEHFALTIPLSPPARLPLLGDFRWWPLQPRRPPPPVVTVHSNSGSHHIVMESLLHWDFSPGLAIESQVRDKFGSTVHFSSANPRSSKEFFLVVSFSSASFPLTEESVALALQSCIGGLSSGFRVLRLSDRRFRFLVASNRVGHFI